MSGYTVGPLRKLVAPLYNAAYYWMFHDYKARSWTEGPLFILQILSFAIIGVLLGSLVEYLVELIPRDREQHLKCGGLVLLQISIITLFIFLATALANADTLTLARSSWRGYLFLLFFFVAQGSISANIMCALSLRYF